MSKRKLNEMYLCSFKCYVCDSPELESIFAVVGLMLHVVEETQEVLQTLKADLITHTENKHKTQIKMS